MAKIYYKFGAMKSGKSMDCLRAIYNYRENNKKVLVLKPTVDTRAKNVESRSGASTECLGISPCDWKLNIIRFASEEKPDVIIIDEAQFLTKQQVESLRYFAYEKDIPVLCYGLAVDYSSHLFEGSKRLFELADDVQELLGICGCGRRAKQNARKGLHGFVKQGASIEIGDAQYVPLCNKCYYEKVDNQ